MNTMTSYQIGAYDHLFGAKDGVFVVYYQTAVSNLIFNSPFFLNQIYRNRIIN